MQLVYRGKRSYSVWGHRRVKKHWLRPEEESNGRGFQDKGCSLNPTETIQDAKPEGSLCGLEDESWGTTREGWGSGGWEGDSGLRLPCGTSGYLPVSMQVLQIVKELVSPSRRRARFGGVCVQSITFVHVKTHWATVIVDDCISWLRLVECKAKKSDPKYHKHYVTQCSCLSCDDQKKQQKSGTMKDRTASGPVL